MANVLTKPDLWKEANDMNERITDEKLNEFHENKIYSFLSNDARELITYLRVERSEVNFLKHCLQTEERRLVEAHTKLSSLTEAVKERDKEIERYKALEAAYNETFACPKPPAPEVGE